MIAKDQPTIFGSQIVAGLSSVDDGNMKKGDLPKELQVGVDDNRKQFLQQLSIISDQTVLVRLSYDKSDFALYEEVSSADKGKGITVDGAPISDALATRDKDVALFLPIADCAGAILFDSKKEVLMVSHLGRQSTEAHGATKSMQFMQEKFGSDSKDILVWLSPAADAQSYPLFSFDHKSLHEVNKEHLLAAGVLPENIEISAIDTATNKNYFSHSQFKKGNRLSDGRFAIVAMIR